MIVVKIELHSAITGAVKEIGRMLICNDGGVNSDPKRGDYSVRVLRRKPYGKASVPSEYRWIDASAEPVTRHGEVKDYPRLSYNVWRLIFRALKSAFPEESSK